MLSRTFLFLSFVIYFFVSFTGLARACETCTIPRLGKESGSFKATSKNFKLFFEYLYEQNNFDVMDARAAHQLHHQGHDFHDKTTEELYHFRFGARLREQTSFVMDLPYVVRNSLEVDDHEILGSKQRSDGLGDLWLIVQEQIVKRQTFSFSGVGGLKFPTGDTHEENSVGTRFEQELQPGSGSFDYVLGGVYEQALIDNRVELKANAAYVFNTEGAQNFEYGDYFSTSIFLDYCLNPGSRFLKTKLGIDTNFRHDQKQKEHGTKVADSGGHTFLVGPSFKLGFTENVSLFGEVLFPTYQNLGGVHQELDYQWTSGGQIRW